MLFTFGRESLRFLQLVCPADFFTYPDQHETHFQQQVSIIYAGVKPGPQVFSQIGEILTTSV